MAGNYPVPKRWFVVEVEKDFATDKLIVGSVREIPKSKLVTTYYKGKKIVSARDELDAFMLAGAGDYVQKGRRKYG